MVSFCWQSPATLQGVDGRCRRDLHVQQTNQRQPNAYRLSKYYLTCKSGYVDSPVPCRQTDRRTNFNLSREKRKMRYRMSASKFTNKSIKLSVATVGVVFVVFPYCCRREQEGQTTTETPRRGCAHQTPEARTYQTRPHGMVWHPNNTQLQWMLSPPLWMAPSINNIISVV